VAVLLPSSTQFSATSSFRPDRSNTTSLRLPGGSLAPTNDAEVEMILYDMHPVYIRKTPNFVFGMGALTAAASPRPSTMRVSAGSMMPSSQRRAVA
jgi:hypothetical protein